MTSRIIHHNFESNKSIATEQKTKVALTASVLAKGRRLAAINEGVAVACITLCGACIGVSICVFFAIFGVI